MFLSRAILLGLECVDIGVSAIDGPERGNEYLGYMNIYSEGNLSTIHLIIKIPNYKVTNQISTTNLAFHKYQPE